MTDLTNLTNLVNSQKMEAGQTHEPYAIFIEQVGDSWKGIALWPFTSRSAHRTTAKEAREWALEQKYYQPTLEDVTMGGRYGA